jgi:glycosyl transferase family 25
VHAYVVNLARSPERRDHIIRELAKTNVDYEFVDAVDGRELDLSDTTLVDQPATTDGSLGDSPAAVPCGVGCALSHLNVYRRILADGSERALVLEDDAVVPPDLGPLADAVAANMSGAEVVLLKFHHDLAPCRVTKQGSVSLPESRLLVRPVDPRILASSCGYVITREACERMVQSIMPVRVKSDSWDYFRRQGALDSLRCVVPMPISDSPDFRSSIDYFPPGSLQARVREWAARSKLPGLHQVLARRRQRTLERRGWVGEFEFVDAPVE